MESDLLRIIINSEDLNGNLFYLSWLTRYVNNKKNKLSHKYIDNIRFYVIKIMIFSSVNGDQRNTFYSPVSTKTHREKNFKVLLNIETY